MESTLGLQHYLMLGTLLFSIGLYGVFTRRNAVAILLSLELMFNAVNINLIAINRYLVPDAAGQVFSAMIFGVAGAEAAVGVAIVLSVYRNFKHINVDNIDLLKW